MAKMLKTFLPWLARFDALFQKGFGQVVLKLLNTIWVPCFSTSVSFTRVARNSNSLSRKLFNQTSTVKVGSGCWALDPLPSEEDLDLYYRSIYWQGKGVESPIVRVRDVVHFNLISRQIPKVVSAGSSFMNFGAGHGGISILMAQAGVEVVNVEPGGLPDLYQSGWSTCHSISDVSEKSIDMCYGSHSLEHVANLEIFIEHLERVLRPPGWVFWEVPNSASPDVGTGVRVPHTYYFTEEFFYSWLPYIEMIDSVPHLDRVTPTYDGTEEGRKEGDVIRVLGHLGLR